MKSLNDQHKEALQLEALALAEHEEITSNVWETRQALLRLQRKQRQAFAHYERCVAERKEIEAALGRERLFQNGSGR